MKKSILILVLLVTLITVSLSAQIFIGSGANVTANSTSNFPALVQVGTFFFNAQHVTFAYTASSVTNQSQVNGYGRLTFDGTNFFVGPQMWNSTNGLVWQTTNQSLPVYASLSITNGQAQTITNLTATTP